MLSQRRLHPTAEGLVHFITDIHIPYVETAKLAKVKQDLVSGDVPTPIVHVAGGDNTNETPSGTGTNVASSDDKWKADFPGYVTDAPWRVGVGNHDIWQNNRTPGAYAAALGQADDGTGAPNASYQDIDAGGFRCLILGVDAMLPGDQTTMAVSAAGLAWLNARLTATSEDCLIFFHAAMQNSALKDPLSAAATWDTSTPGFYAVTEATTTSSADLLAFLADHPNAKAWISGHAHPSPHWIDLVKRLKPGSHNIAHFNCPAVYFPAHIAAANRPFAPAYSAYISYLGDRIEFRVRNHSSKCWDAPSDKGVWTVIL